MKEKKPGPKEVLDLLSKSPSLRAAVVKHLAKNHPTEYLSKVKFDGSKAGGKKFTIPVHSDKEWQE